ncbi:ParB N-terminal domain-containing protein [Luteolibacter arcticus]|uniref:ParB N-terminal domain-containing protein n=1 Tax=Luteolibacter arcticus TaxID=1581411 RepID=A0ABT3GL72_9BACT|nr:plasmid partitioning protein RepB C-terminal domain-containing protein [Luteolibacter arcticus]MCW1924253.1 ParB N-terminal domain-containing protein [Luteolibacter arcticus]
MSDTKKIEAKVAFGMSRLMLPLDRILPIRQVDTTGKKFARYRSIVRSIPETGIIEPLVVYPQKAAKGSYILLDGHYRLAACRELGIAEVECIVASDDESYTYNAKVNRLAPIQEQRMILKAIKSGVPVERIAAALNRNEGDIRASLKITDGLCQEVVNLLKDKQLAPGTLKLLKRVVASRQIEIAELLTAANNYTKPYAEALVLGTPKEKLVDKSAPKPRKIKPQELHRMEVEMESLQKEYKVCEQTFAGNMLQLTLFRGFLKKLLANPKVERFLKNRHAGLHQELSEIAASETIC